MTDNDLENIYKAALQISHYAGLRAVWDSGYAASAGTNLATSIGDPSLTATAPTSDVQAQNITTV